MPGFPIATKKDGFICFAFPDVCKTQVGQAQVPIPYPNIGMLSDASDVAENVKVNGDPVIHKDSTIDTTTGDEAGSIGGVTSSETKGKVEFTSASESVFVNGVGVVRMFDATTQNSGNAVGIVLGGVPTVRVGG